MAFFPGLGGVDAFYEISLLVGIAIGQVLFVIGIVGLRADYASRIGSFGKALLLIGVIGGVVSLGRILLMNLPHLGWDLWVLGLLTLTIALAVYGVVAIRQRVFSRWDFAPLFAG